MSPLSRRSTLQLSLISLATVISGCSVLSRGSEQIDWTTDSMNDDIFSPPVLGDDRVYIGVSEGDILALDTNSGEVDWQRPWSAFMATPVMSEDRLVFRTR